MLKTSFLVKFNKNFIDTALQYGTPSNGNHFGLSTPANISGSMC